VRRGNPAPVADRRPAPAPAAAVTALYDVVLLAGSPRRLSLRLGLDIVAEELIDVDGAQWMVADVRPSEQGPSQLICIYPE
jgi:hypothetical protein